ncbi:MAG: glycosyltransferase [Acidiphilium sp.]|nr:glycosyltransferase [Acidiphilium sp.]
MPVSLPNEISKLRLGISITTFNRCDDVLKLVRKIREMTSNPYDLVICDDGSTDGTVELLRAQGETVVGGTNRGIAWNKNRGIFYLTNIARCDVILLIDDDVSPIQFGWEREWIEAAWRYGHVNNSPPEFRSSVLCGAETASDPGLATAISGWAYAFSRIALSTIGYLDLRFGRYGHEHSDFSFRAVRAGFGGIIFPHQHGSMTSFFVISGGLSAVPSISSGSREELEINGRLLGELGNEPVYRHAWRSDEEMKTFLGEFIAVDPNSIYGRQDENKFDAETYLTLNPDVRSAGFDAFEHYITFGRREKRVFI